MTTKGNFQSRHLAIFAGGKALPRQVALIAAKKYNKVSIIRLVPFCEDLFEDFNHVSCKMGSLRKSIGFLKANKVDDIIFIGTVRRTAINDLGIDLGFIYRLPALLKILYSGDDKLLSGLINLVEKDGFQVIGIDKILPEILAPKGLITSVKTNKKNNLDIAKGSEFLCAMSEFDIGQSVVVSDGRILSVEGAEGTADMLDRTANISNRIKKHGGVLVKFAKINQELRIDRPTIGPETVIAAANARLDGIAIEANKTMIVDIEKTCEISEKNGIFLIGV